MDSWILEGDSYSFLRSAPPTFNLQHLDGPNHVEIFDITSIPSHRSAISETTCLCDIFGDDCESPSLSSSPATSSFLKKDTDEQIPVEEVNDSSGSFHTANGSEHLSDGSDTFEDSKDIKDLLPSEGTGDSNTPPSDATLPNNKREITSAHGSLKLRQNWQESHLQSQDSTLVQDENSSDQQLVTSRSEFRDTNIRVTGSTQNLISPEHLSENKGIKDQTYATSSELKETDSTQEIIDPVLGFITKQRYASPSEQKKNVSTPEVIAPDSSSASGQRDTTISEVRETDSKQENKLHKQAESTENLASNGFFSNLASKASPMENNDLDCSAEENKISMSDILPTENILHGSEIVKSDFSIAQSNLSSDDSDFTPLQDTVSDLSAKDEAHDLRKMSAPLEHEVLPEKSASAHIATFLCDDKPIFSDLDEPNNAPQPSYVEYSTDIDGASMPQKFTISSETRETAILQEHRNVSSFSDTTERPESSVISEPRSPFGSSVDVNSSEPSIIIHSPVGFTLCPSPEPENRPEDLASTSERKESHNRSTPTDKGSFSSFDSKLCPTPEPRSITSTPEIKQKVFICDSSHGSELRSASCSPEIKTTTCSSLIQHSESPQTRSSQNEVLAQTNNVKGIIHTESCRPTTRPTKEDMAIPTTYNLSLTQEGISSPSTTMSRDTISPGIMEKRYTESPTSKILTINESTNIDTSSKFSSMDKCIISPHSTVSTPRSSASPDVHGMRSVEGSISAIPLMNETTNMAMLSVSNLSLTEENISRSPISIPSTPRDIASPEVVGTRYPESSMSNTLPTMDTENVVQPSSTERGISRPASNLDSPIDTATGVLTTFLTNENAIMNISHLSNDSSIESNFIPRDTMSPDTEGTIYTQSSMLPKKEIENMVITPITHVQSTEEDVSRASSSLSISIDTMSSDELGGRCVESSMSTIPPTNETRNMAVSPNSNLSSTDGGISRTSSNLSIPINTESPDIDGIRHVEFPTANIVIINEMTNMANSPINLSLTGGESRPSSNLSMAMDAMCLDVQETKYMQQENEFPINETLDMAVSPISKLSSTEGDISRPPSSSCVSGTTWSTDVGGLISVESPISTTLPTNEAPNMGISPIFNISPIEGGLSSPLSPFSIPRDTISHDFEGTKYTKISNEIPKIEVPNMTVSSISKLSSAEEGISRTPSASSVSGTTWSTDVDGLRCVESPISTTIPTYVATNMDISPIFNISPTEGGPSNPSLNFSMPRDTFSHEEGAIYTKISNVIPENEIINIAVSPISTSLSSTEAGISRPPSTSGISRTTESPYVDGLTCVESPISTTLPRNEAPNMDISPIFNISPTEVGLSNPSLNFSMPRGTISDEVEARICTERSNEIPKNEIINTSNSLFSNFSSSDGGISTPLSTFSIPIDSVYPDVGLLANISMPPIYIVSSIEGGTNTQPSTLHIPRHTASPEISNDIPINENKNMALSLSNHTTSSNMLMDNVSSPKMRYRRSPDRFNDHIPAQEMYIPLGHTDSHCSNTISEKMDLPLMVPVAGQIDDNGCKMSLKSCYLPQDDRTDIASVTSPPEPPAPKLSVKQIKESWEKMNESILNSLNPWQTSKKILTTAKGAKEGNDSRKEMLERELAGSEKTFGQMAIRPGESPSVYDSNNHGMYKGQSSRNKGWSGERVIQEEHALGKGVGNRAEGSYRGEQVELSFSTRNRKGPANHSLAPSSRDTKSGIPPRYFESPLATRRQQSILRGQNLQKENKIGARRVRSTTQSNYSGAGRLSSECTSETSSMGSEIDDADSEVKWFTDQAFRSLSSPQVDYLDMYNSSRGSSVNVSQPSAVDSPGSATWISYADLHDSLRENDNVLCQTSSFLPHGTTDPAKHFEMANFECVDVAVDSKEEPRRGKRTVPKRQIQFKKCNFDELKSTESEGKVVQSTSKMDTTVHQHSTPASVEEGLVHDEYPIKTGKMTFQKSASLDESSPKSKTASSVIQSVLSKKVDTASKEFSRREPFENKKKHIETGEICKAERQNSRLTPECSLSSENFPGKDEGSPHPQRRSCQPKVPPKPVFRASSLLPNNNLIGVAFQGNSLVMDQTRPLMDETLEREISSKQHFGDSENEVVKLREKYNSNSGSNINRIPNCTAICVANTRSRVTNSDNRQPMTPESHKELECSSSTFLSKTPEITLKACNIKDKNMSSLKASLCSELEIDKDTIHRPQLEETPEERMTIKSSVETDNEEDKETNKAKSVMHKVRDVRKLVKNTYNLSFKPSNDIVPEKQKETQPENPHPLHIEYKAISRKDKTSTTQQTLPHTADKSKMPQMESQISRDAGIAKISANTSMSNVQHSDVDLFAGMDKGNVISKAGNCEQSRKLEIPPRPSSKEVSTLVFLQDSTSKSVQKPTCPASPNVKTASSCHSVSMLRKEKGMQADIGVCDVLSEGTGAKPKHINRIEVPLQTQTIEGTSNESQKVKKENADLPSEQKTSINSGLQPSEGSLQVRRSPKPTEVKVLPIGNGVDRQNQGGVIQTPKEQEITVAPLSKPEVRTFSSNTKINALPGTSSKEIELPIQVRSISSDRPKPSVPPKPSYKQPFAEIRSTSTDCAKTDVMPTTSIVKEQTQLKSDVKIIETSARVIHNEQLTNTTSGNTKTLAVSAVTSHKPQTIPLTSTSSSVQKSTTTTSRQEVSITTVQNSNNQQQQNLQEQVIPAASYASNYQTIPVVSPANTYMQNTIKSSNTQVHTNDFHLPTSDDPPSYDERESFSPLKLSDLPPRKQNRYHPTTKHPLCSCTSCIHPQFGQPYHGSQNQTPPDTSHSPGQVISYPGAPPQAQVRPHQCRPDSQLLNYPLVSPKAAIQQAPAMIQPMHHSHTCTAPAIQPYGNEQQQPSTQLKDRRSINQRSPQAPSSATYREHSRSPNVAALDPRSQFFNAQELPPAFGHEYGSDAPGAGGVLYPENASGLGYGQGPRRVLLDPESGKYFYIEVPMQPLRKMLFDPEIGQYVEVLIPQQAMSNSNMYPSTAAPYQGPYHGQGLYTSQYLPYAIPPHSQSAQQPRHPEPSVPTSLHQNSMGYGSTASQAQKSDVKGHPSLDQSYLESMYYIPTGMNASPNGTPSDCYHKQATNMPAASGRRV